MKNLKLILISLFTFFTVFSYALEKKVIKGNKNVVVETREVESFNAIKSEGSVDIVLDNRKGSEIKIVAESNIIPFIETYVNNQELIVKLKSGISYMRLESLEVHVPSESVVKITQTGSGDINSETDLMKESFSINMHGSGDCELEGVFQTIAVESYGSGDLSLDGHLTICKVTKSGSGTVRLKGEGDELVVRSSGSGDLYGDSFIAKKADIINRGSGDGEVSVDTELTLKIFGSGDYSIKGAAENATIEKNGSGSVYASKFKAKSLTFLGRGSGDASLCATTDINVTNHDSGDVHISGDPINRKVTSSGSGDVY